MTLIQQEHNPQLIGETRASHELQAIDLAKVGGRTQHVYAEELRDIVVAHIRIFLTKRNLDGGRFLLDERTLIGDDLWVEGKRCHCDVGSTVWEDWANLAGSNDFDEGCNTTQTGSN